MRGKKVNPEIKSRIIAESLQAGCELGKLAKAYSISRETIYGWRSEHKKSVASSSGLSVTCVEPEARGKATEGSSKFIELSLSEPKQLLNLQEASLKFDNFSFVIEGNLKSSVLVSIVKILEEVC